VKRIRAGVNEYILIGAWHHLPRGRYQHRGPRCALDLCYDEGMKMDADIIQMLQRKQFDGVRYACMDRLSESRIDAQAWTFLGQAMVGLKRGRMAKLCFNRALLLNPYTSWETQAARDADTVAAGGDDRKVLGLLDVPRVPVSACVLTRDNEHTIAECLSALQGAVDEVIVVDTGSVDDTVSIVKSLGIEVHSFPWVDDFSKARNFAMSLTEHDWIFSVDSDEILYDSDRECVRTAAALFEDTISLIFVLQMNSKGDKLSPYPVPRLFRKRHFEWRRPIHEAPQVVDDAGIATPNGLTVRIRLKHSGYDPVKVNLPEKINRNISLLEVAHRENPSDYATRYYLGRELSINHRYDEAIKYLTEAYRLGSRQSDAPLLPLVGAQLAYCHTMRNDLNEAIDVLKRVISDCPEHPDAWFSYGVLLLKAGLNSQEAREAIVNAKRLALQYSGTLPIDFEIATWKADSMLESLL
jgi:tetratricopeptide (TPR) repeat protein